jgi:hypothetical protein
MNQHVTHTDAVVTVTPFRKLSALQWRIIEKVLTERRVRPGRDTWDQDEARRVAWVRAVTSLVQRGILVREQVVFGTLSGHVLRLAISEDLLYGAARSAWQRDEARGMSPEDSPAWMVLYALKERARRRRYTRKWREEAPQGWTPRSTALLGGVAAALGLLAKQHPEDEIDARAIADFFHLQEIPENLVIVLLEQLKSAGHYARILAEARATPPV